MATAAVPDAQVSTLESSQVSSTAALGNPVQISKYWWARTAADAFYFHNTRTQKTTWAAPWGHLEEIPKTPPVSSVMSAIPVTPPLGPDDVYVDPAARCDPAARHTWSRPW